MLLNTLRIVTFRNHIFYHASTVIFVIYMLLIPMPQKLIPNFHVICPNFKTSVSPCIVISNLLRIDLVSIHGEKNTVTFSRPT